ncbi:MAG: hypothetical protein JOZ81_21840 [Chloroflexi bacterium]|nr:hypothetical protein [Chloroflexota bacterium]
MKMLLGPWPADKPLAELRRTFPQVEFGVAASSVDVVAQIVDADAYFGAPNADAVRAARRLRWIQASSAGVEWLEAVPTVVESDIVVTNTRGAHAGTIGEHVFAMLLTFTRQMRFFDECQRQHKWSRAEGEERVQGLAGKTLDVIGLGNIGRAIGQRAAVSRGGIVDEDALAEALRTGRLAGAGLDVTLREPLAADSPLWDVERLIITPHVSAHSQRTMNLMWEIVKENIAHFLAGEPLTNLVDKRLGY